MSSKGGRTGDGHRGLFQKEQNLGWRSITQNGIVQHKKGSAPKTKGGESKEMKMSHITFRTFY
jgi:hypothetical protein